MPAAFPPTKPIFIPLRGIRYDGCVTTIPARAALVMAALAALVFVAACGGPDPRPPENTASPTPTVEPAGFNDADIAFVTGMIPHHQQAVELSALVPQHSHNAGVTKLASGIAAAQQPEIETMKVLRVQWREGAPEPEHGPGSHPPMRGMVDDATMARLQSLNGAEFDKLWLQSMTGHHKGAIEMARTELAGGANADAKRIAQGIADTQQAEIDQMNRMLGGI